jgi:hypothetical protein
MMESTGEVLLLFHDVALGGDALVVADRPADRRDGGIRPALEVGLTRLGHLEDHGDRAHRHRHGELVEEVDPRRPAEPGHEVLTDGLDRRLQQADPLGRERLRDQVAVPGVHRRILRQHRRHVRPALGHDLLEPRQQLRRRLRCGAPEA